MARTATFFTPIACLNMEGMENRNDPRSIAYFAATNARGRSHLFGIRRADRRFHIYLLGKTGVGKSSVVRTLAKQDVVSGDGFAVVDPHGDLVRDILIDISRERRKDVIYLDTPHANWTFNPLAGVEPGHEALAVAEMIEVFRKIWSDDWGPRLEHLLRNALFTLYEVKGSSLADLPRLLVDWDYRTEVARGLQNEEVKNYWLHEFNRYSPAFRAVVVAPLQNKLGALLTDPRLKQILTAKQSSFSLREVMSTGKILLCNLSRGEIGEGPAMMLGAILTARIGLEGLARAKRPESERADFTLYVDECQLVATLSLAGMLSELRKFRVSLVLANQFLGQLDQPLQEAILGNVGTLVAFRLGAADARVIAAEMAPTFSAEDFISLPNHHIYLRLMIDTQVSKPFSATTIKPAA